MGGVVDGVRTVHPAVRRDPCCRYPVILSFLCHNFLLSFCGSIFSVLNILYLYIEGTKQLKHKKELSQTEIFLLYASVNYSRLKSRVCGGMIIKCHTCAQEGILQIGIASPMGKRIPSRKLLLYTLQDTETPEKTRRKKYELGK